MTAETARALAISIITGVRVASGVATRTGRAQAFDLAPCLSSIRDASLPPFPHHERAAVVAPRTPEDELVGVMKRLYSARVSGEAIPVQWLRQFAPELLGLAAAPVPPPAPVPPAVAREPERRAPSQSAFAFGD